MRRVKSVSDKNLSRIHQTQRINQVLYLLHQFQAFTMFLTHKLAFANTHSMLPGTGAADLHCPSNNVVDALSEITFTRSGYSQKNKKGYGMTVTP